MKERPILFSGPMVRAILDGRKTVTRRVLKQQPPEWATFCQELQGLYVTRGWAPSGLWQWCEPEQDPPRKLRRWPVHTEGPMAGIDYGMKMPCAIGDRLWVREAFTMGFDYDDHDKPIGDEPKPFYAATYSGRWYDPDTDEWRDAPRWRPSIHMPRWASRIALEVTGVKVERLRQMNRGDAMAEGCPFPNMASGPSPLTWFRELWDGLNGEREGASWEANPWVVAIGFRRLDAAFARPTDPTPASFDRILAEAKDRFDALTPEQQREHRAEQQRSWVRGEMMLDHPEMTREQVDALIVKAGRS